MMVVKAWQQGPAAGVEQRLPRLPRQIWPDLRDPIASESDVESRSGRPPYPRAAARTDIILRADIIP